MNEFKVFEVARKRTLVLMQEWLRNWKLPPAEPLYCPKCQTKKIYKTWKSLSRKTLRCAECRYEFSLEELPGCRCTYPGGLLTCFDCKHYQNMMDYVKQNQERISQLSEGELDNIINSPGFWKRNVERQPSMPPGEHAQHEQAIAPQHDWKNPSPYSTYQLSLFDNVFYEVQNLNNNSQDENPQGENVHPEDIG